VRTRDELLAAITREQALIGRLEREREEAQARVRSLQAQLGAPAEDVEHSVSPAPPFTAQEKVALFRSLFRGRDDVFPKLWVNPRTDRKGYAPACANEWVRGVCEKPRINAVRARPVRHRLEEREGAAPLRTSTDLPRDCVPGGGSRTRSWDLPSPPPNGAEWIEAYRYWARGR